MTWYLGAKVGAGGWACLIWGHISWAVAGIREAAVVGCNGGMMTSNQVGAVVGFVVGVALGLWAGVKVLLAVPYMTCSAYLYRLVYWYSGCG
jgi:hypothetical protein